MRPALTILFALTVTAGAATAQTERAADQDRSAILATCHDYIDGQLQGDAQRVARALHPDLAKRRVIQDNIDERYGLQRMTKEELVDLTRRAVLKTPRKDWQRSCRILDITGDTAAVRLETPWFVDQFHIGNFDGQWLTVNALWLSK